MRCIIKTWLLNRVIKISGKKVPVYGLASLTISPERRGIGRLSLELFKELAVQNGKYAVIGFVTDDALEFYIKCGWHVCGEFEGHTAVSSVPLQATFTKRW